MSAPGGSEPAQIDPGPPRVEAGAVSLAAQQAVLHEGLVGGRPARIWILDPAGAGPAAVAAARRDLEVLAGLPAGDPLRVLASGEVPDGSGRIWAAVSGAPVTGDRSLREVLAEDAPLPLPRVLALARGLCGAVAALHQQGLVHGGLNPSMVRLPAAESSTDRGASSPLLLGAGWSALRAAWSTRSTPRPEVLRYLAPEVIRARSAQPDRRADLFSLGCVIFEALTGRPVFAAGEPAALSEEILRPERPDLRELLGPAEEPLSRVLGRCLAADPDRRHPSATALWRELAPALGGRATPLPAYHDAGGQPAGRSVPPTPSPQPAQSPDRGRTSFIRAGPPNRMLWTAGLTVSAAAVALGLLFLGSRSTEPVAPDRAVPPARPDGPSATDHDGTSATDHDGTSATDHDGRGSPRDQGAHALRAPDRQRRSESGPGAASGDGSPARDPHAPPLRVAVDPRTVRLRATLARVGLSPEEAVVSQLLERHLARATAALRKRDYRDFDEAMRPLELFTRPRRCRRIWRLKRAYIIGGIRHLGEKLGRWERFRLERMLADAEQTRGSCRLQSDLLRPLVLEVRDRLAYKRTRGE